MPFNSIVFCFLFLPLTILLYFLVPKKLKNLYLLLISILFYSYSGLFNTIILLFMVFYNYISVRKMDRLGKRRKYKLIEILIINLFVLCYFKYYYLLLSNLFQNVSFKEILHTLRLSYHRSFR